MTNQDIILNCESAEQMAARIWEAYVTGAGIEQAKKDQKSLALWVSKTKECGYVYNGAYDEYITLKL